MRFLALTLAVSAGRLVPCKGKDSALDIEALPEDGTMVTLGWRRDADANAWESSPIAGRTAHDACEHLNHTARTNTG